MKTAVIVLTIAVAGCAGAAFAQQSAGVQGSASASAQASASGTEMNATLERAVNARRAQPGDEVRARLVEEVRVEDGVIIEQGATLVGRVTAASPHQRASRTGGAGVASTLEIVFDRAILPDGREIPMHATIQALAAAQGNATTDLQHDGFAAADARIGGSGAGMARGRADPSGVGSVVGGVGATAGAAGSAAGSVAGSATGAAGRVSGTAATSTRAGGRVGRGGASVDASASSSGSAAGVGSIGTVGGLDAAGHIVAGSHGAFGINGLEIDAPAAGRAQGSVISSAARNVRLASGTRLLLVKSASASAR